jgi:SAM-dependent methyltransferase
MPNATFMPTLRNLKRKLRYFRNSISELVPWTPDDKFPVPPPPLRDKVRKGQITREGFIREGHQAYLAIVEAAKQIGVSLNEGKRVFEFGCGCGRLARHFLHAGADYSGSDVDSELVKWSNSNLRDGAFTTNAYRPPLLHDDNSFDLCFAISVFTHIPVNEQRGWIDELCRITRPGGGVILSYLPLDEGSPEDTKSTTRTDVGIRRNWLGKNNAPSVYCNVYHTVRHIADNWTAPLILNSTVPLAIRSTQSLALLSKPLS